MVKLLQIIFLGLLFFSCSSLNYNLDINNLAFNTVKRINSANGGHCSSVFINYKDKIRHITNAHCCNKPMSYVEELVFFKKVDVKNDLCELTHNSIPNYGIELSNIKTKIGDTVYHIGYPFEFILTKSFGEVHTLNYDNNAGKQLLTLTSALTLPGMSGGAAINKNGKLIGIISQTDKLGQGRFIPIEVLIGFLN